VVKSMRSRLCFPPQMFLQQVFVQMMAVTLVLISLGTTRSVAQSKSGKGNATQQQAGKAPTASVGGSDVARGKYIVEGVALCGQCHTPVDSEGNPDRRRWLQGGSVPWQSSRPNTDWPQMVPRIGGVPPAPDEDMVKLLTTGIWTTGARLRPPMPQFRMNVSDAQAVVAYLKSLTPGQ
jgi:mono/diheme cytochrome c family protein